ncbi:MAG: hypothetical protein ACXVEF_02535 [Polyangiales bacterium]
MKRLLLLVVPLVVSLAPACSSEKDHAPLVGGACTSNCGTIGGGGTDSSTDVATDVTEDTSFEVGEAGVSLIGKVHFLGAFPREPSSGTPQTNVTVRGNRQGGGTTEIAVVAADGSFTLDGIAPSFGIPTWLSIVKTGVVKGYVGIRFPVTGTDPLDLPLFDETLPVATAVSGTTTSGTGTIVIHTKDSLGARVAGVTANPVGDAKPYYDSGSDSVEITASATGSKGTIVFLGLTPGSSTVTLTWMGKVQPSITIPTSADAISWTAVTIE